jgi:hypothetical protein
MLLFVDEQDENQEELLAGLRPLPINRMVKQAGREANDFYTKGRYGKFERNRDGKVYRNKDGTPQSRENGRPNEWNSGPREGVMPKDLKERTLNRQQKAKDAIDNWDPIEASAKEDYNRLKGGRRGPAWMGPGAADELIHTIETPIAPATSIGDLKYGI